ncbi:MAG: thioredoxin domain-containing protein [Acidobacteria bacterium]|nr:MAG: thioredoxin domain-containing protein [Acidobacteriota bacterium]
MNAAERGNRLARETSPYLRQHQHNPVDWYPWGEEALARSRAEDRPIFLSIGYSACHWCHVMERESFEDERVAALMNERFVSIKVDREERPDLDEIYMAATQLLTGQGGWPNSVFLTPDLKPFYAGTYFPPDSRHGRPGFSEVLTAVSDAYRQRKDEVARVSEEVSERIRSMSALAPSVQLLTPSILNRAFGELAGRFDPAEGGFGGAPKFPHGMDVSFLLRYHRRTGNPEALRMAVVSLEKMACGGIYDHLGGGFHRYATDARWLVPHFEKMLYDNALLVRAYLEGARALAAPAHDPRPEGAAGAGAMGAGAGAQAAAAFFAGVARETCDWVLREMTSPQGGFYSALDADSDGEEGKFYVWDPREIEAVLGKEEAAFFAGLYGVTRAGNFEGGRSIPHLEKPPAALAAGLGIGEGDLRLRLASARARLLAARERRVRPGRDEKVLADWNGLMIGALAFAARRLDEPRYAEAAARGARLVLDRMRRDGRLLHSFMDGEARQPGFLTDYANLVMALLDLYEATFDPAWVREARPLADMMIELFRDERQGGFFFTARDHETLIARTREGNDGATPAGASVATLALPRLAELTGEERYREAAEETLRLYRDNIERFPSAFGMMLCALDQHLDRGRMVVLAGRRGDRALSPFLTALAGAGGPNTVVALADPEDREAPAAVPAIAGKVPVGGAVAAYVCEHGSCKAPVTSPDEMLRLLTPP